MNQNSVLFAQQDKLTSKFVSCMEGTIFCWRHAVLHVLTVETEVYWQGSCLDTQQEINVTQVPTEWRWSARFMKHCPLLVSSSRVGRCRLDELKWLQILLRARFSQVSCTTSIVSFPCRDQTNVFLGSAQNWRQMNFQLELIMVKFFPWKRQGNVKACSAYELVEQIVRYSMSGQRVIALSFTWIELHSSETDWTCLSKCNLCQAGICVGVNWKFESLNAKRSSPGETHEWSAEVFQRNCWLISTQWVGERDRPSTTSMLSLHLHIFQCTTERTNSPSPGFGEGLIQT